MKRKSGFVLRQVCGEYVIVGEGLERVNFNKMISLNATAAYLWDAVESKEFSVQTLTDMLLDKYDVDEKTAAEDACKAEHILSEQTLEKIRERALETDSELTKSAE